MRVAFAIAISVSLAACSKAKSEPVVDDPTARANAVFDETARLLAENHLQQGYVVSLKADGSADHVGEGILWSGVAAGSLRCAQAEPIVAALAAHAAAATGALRRFEPLPAEYTGHELNFDGETGLIYGLALYSVHCPGDAAAAALWTSHQASIAANGGRLYPESPETMAPGFGFTTAALSHAISGAPAPSSASLWELEEAAAAWVGAVGSSWSAFKAGLIDSPRACYPANLAFLHLRTAEALGYSLSPTGRAEFCAATAPMGIPNIDAWCGREALAAWIDAYVPNAYEFRFQRCSPPWEQADGEGDETPAVDLLMAIRQAYDITN